MPLQRGCSAMSAVPARARPPSRAGLLGVACWFLLLSLLTRPTAATPAGGLRLVPAALAPMPTGSGRTDAGVGYVLLFMPTPTPGPGELRALAGDASSQESPLRR
jgi:hypothetical protein